MGIIPAQVVKVKPVSVLAYFDRVQVWLERPAHSSVLAQLRKHSGHLFCGNYHARFDRRFVQRLELKQPDANALRVLAGLNGGYINRLEIALDYAFGATRERDRFYEFLDQTLVRRWHGRKQQIRVHPGKAETRYDGPRYAANSTVVYKENHSRITGELDIVHIEWRASNRRGVKAAGIRAVRDLTSFDHRAFWKKRLLLFAAEAERLGRFISNRRGRKGRPEKSRLDHKRGRVVINSVSNIQELIDRYGSRLQIRRALTVIQNESWLPGLSDVSDITDGRMKSALVGKSPYSTAYTTKKVKVQGRSGG